MYDYVIRYLMLLSYRDTQRIVARISRMFCAISKKVILFLIACSFNFNTDVLLLLLLLRVIKLIAVKCILSFSFGFRFNCV